MSVCVYKYIYMHTHMHTNLCVTQQYSCRYISLINVKFTQILDYITFHTHKQTHTPDTHTLHTHHYHIKTRKTDTKQTRKRHTTYRQDRCTKQTRLTHATYRQDRHTKQMKTDTYNIPPRRKTNKTDPHTPHREKTDTHSTYRHNSTDGRTD